MSRFSSHFIGVAAVVAAIGGVCAATSAGSTAAPGPVPQQRLNAHMLRPRRGAVAPGTAVSSSAVFSNRVFANAQIGFALANHGTAQYPVRSADGGRSWRIDGPQVHIDAADAPEAVSYVGVVGSHTFFTYGSSVIDVTSDSGNHWWQTYPDGLVSAVTSNPRGQLVAYVQQSVGNSSGSPAVTWQYISNDGGKHWHFSTALGG